MSIGSIQRRVGRLRSVLVSAPVVQYSPLTTVEIEAFARRGQIGEWPTDDEVARFERQGTISEGELLITARQGHVIVKRYCGIDLAQI